MKMENKEIVDMERALEEKKTMQKVFLREFGYPSSVLALLIAYFEEKKEKK